MNKAVSKLSDLWQKISEKWMRNASGEGRRSRLAVSDARMRNGSLYRNLIHRDRHIQTLYLDRLKRFGRQDATDQLIRAV